MFSRREILAGVTAGTAQALLQAQAARRPNIVLFVADDLGCHDLGAWGATELADAEYRFPGGRRRALHQLVRRRAGLRALARRAVDRTLSIRAGVPDNGPPLRPSEKTIATVLKTAGYATGLFGKWHLGSTTDTDPNAHGFDRFYGFHSGCIDYYSHRYYWGEPRIPNYHDLWRDRTEIFEDGQYSTELFAREAAQFVRDHRAGTFLRLRAVQCAALSHACAEKVHGAVRRTCRPNGAPMPR